MNGADELFYQNNTGGESRKGEESAPVASEPATATSNAALDAALDGLSGYLGSAAVQTDSKLPFSQRLGQLARHLVGPIATPILAAHSLYNNYFPLLRAVYANKDDPGKALGAGVKALASATFPADHPIQGVANAASQILSAKPRDGVPLYHTALSSIAQDAVARYLPKIPAVRAQELSTLLDPSLSPAEKMNIIHPNDPNPPSLDDALSTRLSGHASPSLIANLSSLAGGKMPDANFAPDLASLALQKTNYQPGSPEYTSLRRYAELVGQLGSPTPDPSSLKQAAVNTVGDLLNKAGRPELAEALGHAVNIANGLKDVDIDDHSLPSKLGTALSNAADREGKRFWDGFMGRSESVGDDAPMPSRQNVSTAIRNTPKRARFSPLPEGNPLPSASDAETSARANDPRFNPLPSMQYAANAADSHVSSDSLHQAAALTTELNHHIRSKQADDSSLLSDRLEAAPLESSDHASHVELPESASPSIEHSEALIHLQHESDLSSRLESAPLPSTRAEPLSASSVSSSLPLPEKPAEESPSLSSRMSDAPLALPSSAQLEERARLLQETAPPRSPIPAHLLGPADDPPSDPRPPGTEGSPHTPSDNNASQDSAAKPLTRVASPPPAKSNRTVHAQDSDTSSLIPAPRKSSEINAPSDRQIQAIKSTNSDRIARRLSELNRLEKAPVMAESQSKPSTAEPPANVPSHVDTSHNIVEDHILGTDPEEHIASNIPQSKPLPSLKELKKQGKIPEADAHEDAVRTSASVLSGSAMGSDTSAEGINRSNRVLSAIGDFFSKGKTYLSEKASSIASSIAPANKAASQPEDSLYVDPYAPTFGAGAPSKIEKQAAVDAVRQHQKGPQPSASSHQLDDDDQPPSAPSRPVKPLISPKDLPKYTGPEAEPLTDEPPTAPKYTPLPTTQPLTAVSTPVTSAVALKKSVRAAQKGSLPPPDTSALKTASDGTPILANMDSMMPSKAIVAPKVAIAPSFTQSSAPSDPTSQARTSSSVPTTSSNAPASLPSLTSSAVGASPAETTNYDGSVSTVLNGNDE